MKRGRPSNTALVVAAGLQLASTRTTAPADALHLGAGLLQRAHPRLAALLRRTLFRRLCDLLEGATLPGICTHFVLRKRILRRHAQTALAAGCTQVVVLGAGYDTLCMELRRARPDICCIAIDHPATQAAKRAAVDNMDSGGTGFIAADLAQQKLAPLLAAHPGFRADASTLYVAEGLLMYMPLDAVRALFAQMAEATPCCRVAFTWFEPRHDGRAGFHQYSRLIEAWLRWRGEPFLSSMAPAKLESFLTGAGFMLQHLNASSDILDGVRVTPQPIEGEYIALASTVIDCCA
jgi:methyltransferase (TIGR00027 family)